MFKYLTTKRSSVVTVITAVFVLKRKSIVSTELSGSWHLTFVVCVQKKKLYILTTTVCVCVCVCVLAQKSGDYFVSLRRSFFFCPSSREKTAPISAKTASKKKFKTRACLDRFTILWCTFDRTPSRMYFITTTTTTRLRYRLRQICARVVTCIIPRESRRLSRIMGIVRVSNLRSFFSKIK